MSNIAFGFVDGHLVTWTVRDVTWCSVCGERESTTEDGWCVRCEADVLVLSLGPRADVPPDVQ